MRKDNPYYGIGSRRPRRPPRNLEPPPPAIPPPEYAEITCHLTRLTGLGITGPQVYCTLFLYQFPEFIESRARKKLILTATGSLTRNNNSQDYTRIQDKALLLDGYEETSFTKTEANCFASLEREKPSKWTMDRIDRISMVAFPSLFTLFNIVYWGYYLSFAE